MSDDFFTATASLDGERFDDRRICDAEPARARHAPAYPSMQAEDASGEQATWLHPVSDEYSARDPDRSFLERSIA